MYNMSVFVTNGRGNSAAVSKRVLSKEAGLTMQCFIVKIVLSLCQYPAVLQPTHRQVKNC